MDLSLARLGVITLRNRRSARAPVTLYRRGFGWVFGSRLLLLEHTGRRSGQARYAVLEVIGQPEPDLVMVASGFGPSSQWYRNLEASPACHVSIGRIQRRAAEARLLTRTESAAALDDYRRRHPGAWAVLRRVIEKDAAQDPAEIPVVAFHLAGTRGAR